MQPESQLLSKDRGTDRNVNTPNSYTVNSVKGLQALIPEKKCVRRLDFLTRIKSHVTF